MTADVAHLARIRTRTAEIAHDVLAPVAAIVRSGGTVDERFAATRPFYGRLVEAGLLRAIIPEHAGGDGTSLTETAVIVEELMAVDANVSLTLLATGLGLAPVVTCGSAAQRRRLLAPFLSGAGTPLAAFGLTEPGGIANADAAPPAEGLRSTAVPHGRGWTIEATKKWISNAAGWDGGGADLTTLVLRTSPGDPGTGQSVFAVPRQRSGFVHEATPDTVGHRAHATPTVSWHRISVPKSAVIGGVGGGAAVVGTSFLPSVALVGSFAVGMMTAAFDSAVDFARRENRGGAVPIIEHQAVGYALVDAKIRIEAVRSLTYRACAALDAGSPDARELALQAKVFGSESAVRCITELMTVVGVDAYGHDLPLAGLLQDALALPVFGGSNRGVRRRQLLRVLRDGGGSEGGGR